MAQQKPLLSLESFEVDHIHEQVSRLEEISRLDHRELGVEFLTSDSPDLLDMCSIVLKHSSEDEDDDAEKQRNPSEDFLKPTSPSLSLSRGNSPSSILKRFSRFFSVSYCAAHEMLISG